MRRHEVISHLGRIETGPAIWQSSIVHVHVPAAAAPDVQRAVTQPFSSFPRPAQVTVTGNTFVDNMCSGTDGYTFNGGEPWTRTSQPLTFINVTGLNLAGNTISNDGNCAASQVRHKRSTPPKQTD